MPVSCPATGKSDAQSKRTRFQYGARREARNFIVCKNHNAYSRFPDLKFCERDFAQRMCEYRTHKKLHDCTRPKKQIKPRIRSLSRQSHNSRAIAVAFAMVYFFWGSTFIAVSYGVETIPPLILVGIRQLIAGIVLYPLARFRSNERPTIHHWLSGALIGGLLFVGGNGSIAWAEAKLTPTNITAVMVATVPLWMALMDCLRPGGPA